MVRSGFKKDLFAVILVGGKGKRLRPLSTDRRPKAFLSVTRSKKTMFADTIGRVVKIIPPENIVVVANKRHARLVRKDLPAACRKNIILEPVSRNTAPAIALAAYRLWKDRPDAVIVMLPTDQYVPDARKQLICIERGIDFVNSHGRAMVVVGLKPRYPATQFGYIKTAKTGGAIKRVERFTEKPDLKTAQRYTSGGRHLWNTGILIVRVDTLLTAIKKHEPGISRILNTGNAIKLYEKMPDISMDYAVLERAKDVYCVNGSYEWSDMGSFDELKKVLEKESRRFVEKDGKIVKII